MDITKFNSLATEIYVEPKAYDQKSFGLISEFKETYFKHIDYKELLEMYHFRKFRIADIYEEFNMNVLELEDFTTILFIDETFALVNVDF